MNIKEYIQNKIENIDPPTFKQCFIAVGGIHIIVIGGIMFASIPKTHAKEDKAFLNSPEGEYTPTPTPTPLRKEVLPDGRTATYPPPQNVEYKKEEKKVVNPKYTQSYIIKKGDTFNSIVKRFKLNPTKLKELNSITNENKLKEGQVLKFL